MVFSVNISSISDIIVLQHKVQVNDKIVPNDMQVLYVRIWRSELVVYC